MLTGCLEHLLASLGLSTAALHLYSGGSNAEQPGSALWEKRKVQGSRAALQKSSGDQREGEKPKKTTFCLTYITLTC